MFVYKLKNLDFKYTPYFVCVQTLGCKRGVEDQVMEKRMELEMVMVFDGVCLCLLVKFVLSKIITLSKVFIQGPKVNWTTFQM